LQEILHFIVLYNHKHYHYKHDKELFYIGVSST